MYDIQDVIKDCEQDTKEKVSFISQQSPYKRMLAYKLYNCLQTNKQIYVTGIRKVGKSTILAQLCEKFNSRGIKTIILDISLINSKDENFDNYLGLFNMLKQLGYTNIFIDEVCKVKNYKLLANYLNHAYSMGLNFIVTGSSIPGVKFISNKCGRGIDYVLPEWTYTEYLLLHHASNLDENPYTLDNSLAYNSYNNLEDFLYYNNNVDVLTYVAYCIQDNLDSSYIRGFIQDNNIDKDDIRTSLDIIAYAQILTLYNNMVKSFNIEPFRKLPAYINNIYGTNLSYNDISNILNIDTIKHSLNLKLKNTTKSYIANILSLLTGTGLVTLQSNLLTRRRGTEDIIDSILDGDDVSDISVHINSSALSMYLYHRTITLVLNKLNLDTSKVAIQSIMKDNFLELKGNLMESYLFTLLKSNLQYTNISKYRNNSSGLEVDLVIDYEYGIEVKYRKLSNLTSKHFKVCEDIMEETSISKMILTTTDTSTQSRGINVVNLGELLCYIEHIVMKDTEDEGLSLVKSLFIPKDNNRIKSF